MEEKIENQNHKEEQKKDQNNGGISQSVTTGDVDVTILLQQSSPMGGFAAFFALIPLLLLVFGMGWGIRRLVIRNRNLSNMHQVRTAEKDQLVNQLIFYILHLKYLYKDVRTISHHSTAIKNIYDVESIRQLSKSRGIASQVAMQIIESSFVKNSFFKQSTQILDFSEVYHGINLHKLLDEIKSTKIEIKNCTKNDESYTVTIALPNRNKDLTFTFYPTTLSLKDDSDIFTFTKNDKEEGISTEANKIPEMWKKIPRILESKKKLQEQQYTVSYKTPDASVSKGYTLNIEEHYTVLHCLIKDDKVSEMHIAVDSEIYTYTDTSDQK